MPRPADAVIGRDAMSAGIRRVLWITLGFNLLVAAAKLGYGMSSGLIAMAADGVHSLLDASGNVVGLIAMHRAHAPPDRGHPYGHRKFEALAALGVGVLLGLACKEILEATWHRLAHGSLPDVGAEGFVIMAATMAVNVGVAAYERREGKRLRSEFLLADAAHTASDTLVSLCVIVALATSLLGWEIVDVLVSLVIVAWIARIAWRVARPALSTLADEARVDPAAVDEAAMAIDGVRDVHRIRTRGQSDHVYMDLHVQVDPDATVRDAHGTAHRVEETIKARFPEVIDVVVHLEPHGDPVEGLDGSVIGPPRDARPRDRAAEGKPPPGTPIEGA
jgi:cation diffusion facilitator family transporter